MKTKIKINKDNSIAKSDWAKIKLLPYGGRYANNSSGFNDHIDEQGNIYRVQFATWLTGEKVYFAGK